MTVTYAYDALGRRVQRTSSAGATAKFVYDGADVLRDLDGNGVAIADYLNGPAIDDKLRQTVGGIASYFVTDHLGTTRALTDSSGNLTSSLSYDSYGNLTTGSASTRYTYTGRELDSEMGLMYYRARWYDPQQGSFISEDPIGFDGGLNWFTYVGNDPINYADPSGLSGGRGPGHSVSLRRDPRKWLERFKGRRGRNRGDKPGEDEQLRNRCRELEKWLLALTMVSLSEADLHRNLLNQYDWCRKKFPSACKDPALDPHPAGSQSEEPATSTSQNRSWEGGEFDAVPRWDDGTPLDPARHPDAYRDHRARRAAGYRGPSIFPVNPASPRFPEVAPVRIPVRPVFVP